LNLLLRSRAIELLLLLTTKLLKYQIIVLLETDDFEELDFERFFSKCDFLNLERETLLLESTNYFLGSLSLLNTF